MKSFVHILLGTTVVLVACSAPSSQNIDSENEVSPPKDNQTSEALRETPNVTYTGTVAPAGISIYQEGSHRLVLSDDRFILLESSSVDLNGYVHEKVKATGSVRPTVEEGGMLMLVEHISLVSNPVEEEQITQEPEGDASGSGEKLPPVNEGEDTQVAREPTEEPEPAESEPPAKSLTVSAEMLAVIEAMAKDDYSPERWTQPHYCTSHIGFCIPIHKNWWFKSFGNTTSHLWHLELSNKEISELGDGPILVKLVSGSLNSKKATEKEVRFEGNTVIGFRSWNETSHFEIVADARLENPVRYLTQELSRYEE